jgi:hypothetical protein
MSEKKDIKTMEKELRAAKREANNNATTQTELRKDNRLDIGAGLDPSAPIMDKPKKIPNVAAPPPRRRKKFRSINESNPWE